MDRTGGPRRHLKSEPRRRVPNKGGTIGQGKIPVLGTVPFRGGRSRRDLVRKRGRRGTLKAFLQRQKESLEGEGSSIMPRKNLPDGSQRPTRKHLTCLPTELPEQEGGYVLDQSEKKNYKAASYAKKSANRGPG